MPTPENALYAKAETIRRFLNSPEFKGESHASRERVIARLLASFEEWLDRTDDGSDDDGINSIFLLALNDVMQGATPADALADYGMLDGE
jgi:hypothetical protein